MPAESSVKSYRQPKIPTTRTPEFEVFLPPKKLHIPRPNPNLLRHAATLRAALWRGPQIVAASCTKAAPGAPRDRLLLPVPQFPNQRQDAKESDHEP